MCERRVPSASRVATETSSNEYDQFNRMIVAAEQLMLVTFGNYIRGLLEWRLQSCRGDGAQNTEPASDDVDRINAFLRTIDPNGYVASVDVECAVSSMTCRLSSSVEKVGFEYEMPLDKYLKPTFMMIDRLVNILLGYYSALLKQHDELENAFESVFGTSKLSIEPQARTVYLLPDYQYRIQIVPRYVEKAANGSK